ncbi:hypothetical protein [Corynebacterium cystitidis]|uniref:Uncharacterized protein n=1 Tax=Corynebacterium cystitidis DSM 20524 TaxID=1121357 RepID=A0A1H9WKF5_9CORY|nr:hypothetical protein [Corynebacterium cystitidis]WJY83426.1 hypothetical protein CCYS_12695 [Corynebacterium cystitidis DSM 20524]SES34378.1 hypothetical protein SAMN05661109_02786 [Corynebacterium cystitidis DSM 20524]SNV61755.1 Uncharacterised protein [Corynebacterium cystitidis]
MTDYSYPSVGSGEAYRETMEILGWRKPRKDSPMFVLAVDKLNVHVYFGYASFRRNPTNFSALTSISVHSPSWGKVAKKIHSSFERGLVAPLTSLGETTQGILGTDEPGSTSVQILRPSGSINQARLAQFTNDVKLWVETMDILLAFQLRDRFFPNQLFAPAAASYAGYLNHQGFHEEAIHHIDYALLLRDSGPNNRNDESFEAIEAMNAYIKETI